jgi:predicted lactoylglutathione lyase
MDISTLKRDCEYVHKALSEVGDSLVALKPLKIYLPEIYQASGLLYLTDTTQMFATFGIVVDDKYSVSIAAAMCNTEPDNITIITIGNEKYYEFSYEKGSKVMTSVNLVQSNTILIKIYKTFFTSANVPWYFNYDVDYAMVFDTAELHAKSSLRINNAMIEFLVSIIARDSSNKTKFFRYKANVTKLMKPIYIPLSAITLQATNTFAKLAGGYFNDGLTSALVNPTTTNESIETLIRQ